MSLKVERCYLDMICTCYFRVLQNSRVVEDILSLK